MFGQGDMCKDYIAIHSHAQLRIFYLGQNSKDTRRYISMLATSKAHYYYLTYINITATATPPPVFAVPYVDMKGVYVSVVPDCVAIACVRFCCIICQI